LCGGTYRAAALHYVKVDPLNKLMHPRLAVTSIRDVEGQVIIVGKVEKGFGL